MIESNVCGPRPRDAQVPKDWGEVMVRSRVLTSIARRTDGFSSMTGNTFVVVRIRLTGLVLVIAPGDLTFPPTDPALAKALATGG